MPTDVVMPQMGESIFEGTITKWLKKAGDPVHKDEPLFEISTDKVDAEIPSPVAGFLSEIKVPEGATVEVNTVVAVISETGARVVSLQPVASPPPVAAQTTAAKPEWAPAQASGPGTPVVMPQMGESIFEGTITKWLKQAGDRVEKDEPLFEISTDKVDAEIPAPVAGILTAINTPAGATVEINTVVAVIGGSLDARSEAMAQAVPAEAAPLAPPASGSQPAPPIDPGRQIRSSPLVRRIARENSLDLARIAGTGSAGRINKDDILRHLATYGPGGAAHSPEMAKSQPAPPQVAQLAAPQVPGQAVPLSRMRAIIAERMVESKRISPHVHTVYKVDMTRIARLRDRERARFEQQHGVKLSYMPFIAAAAVRALAKYPIVNASLVDGSIHYHPNINLGIAVALDWGLIVPVVKQAETRSFLDLARSIADLAARARAKKLQPDEVQGGTFTLTNSGVFGGEYGTPIINQPESAILAIGGLRKEPVVLTDPDGNDSIAIRSMLTFCLGFDHRTIDGADSGKFMSEFKKALETWDKPIG